MRLLRSDHATGWLFVAPASSDRPVRAAADRLVVRCSRSSTTTCSRPPHWVGTANYRALQHDPVFRESVRNTVVYTVLFVPISIGLALGVAVALNARVRCISIYRTAVFIPVAVSTVATGDHLQLGARPDVRHRQLALNEVGISSQGFFHDPDQALYCVVVDDGVGLGRVRRDHLPGRAAGHPAGAARGGRRSTARRAGRRSARSCCRCSGRRPCFLVVWSTINALQLFDEIYNTTRGGPLQSTTVVVYYLWQQAFQFFDGRLRGRDRLRAVRGDPGGHAHPARRSAAGPCTTRSMSLPPLQPCATCSCAPLALLMAVAAALDDDHVDPDAGRVAPLPAGPDSRRASTGTTTPARYRSAPFGSWYVNSLIVSPWWWSRTWCCAAWPRYAFARLRFFGSNVLLHRCSWRR